GQIVLLNQNGVFFGPKAKVDVAGLLASTGKIDADLFMNTGKISLSDINFNPNAKIENQGEITVAGAGIAAFVAPSVINSGLINAQLGKIHFGAGANKATVDMYGDGLVELVLDDNASKALIDNSGRLVANELVMTAKGAAGVVDSMINMSGIVEA